MRAPPHPGLHQGHLGLAVGLDAEGLEEAVDGGSSWNAVELLLEVAMLRDLLNTLEVVAVLDDAMLDGGMMAAVDVSHAEESS